MLTNTSKKHTQGIEVLKAWYVFVVVSLYLNRYWVYFPVLSRSHLFMHTLSHRYREYMNMRKQIEESGTDHRWEFNRNKLCNFYVVLSNICFIKWARSYNECA